MDKDALINGAYELFSIFEKPLKCTVHDDCPECGEYEATLGVLRREDLSVLDIGTSGYGPLPNMTPEAIAYFLPRLIELSLNNEKDADETPVLIRLIGLLADGLRNDRFKLLSGRQADCLLDVLLYIQSEYNDTVEYECWGDELNNAINNWKINNGA
ncbi:MAG: hypothetical protein HQL04_01055 [Nitrospirae bacterium]|nr:hypothetical protein [Nitrospirota bacterium]